MTVSTFWNEVVEWVYFVILLDFMKRYNVVGVEKFN
jgi:hypothetical protein